MDRYWWVWDGEEWHIKNATEKESMDEETYECMNNPYGAAVLAGPFRDTMEF